MKPKVSIVVVNWNLLKYLKLCIKSIRQYTQYENYEIIVVDNESKDGSKEWLSKQKDLKIITNKDNLGWVKSVNQGLSQAKGEYLIFMNNDIEVTDGWITKMLTHYRQETGIVVPTMNNISGLQNTHYDTYYPLKHHEVRFVMGACVLLHRDVYNLIGGLDEIFGMGNSDDLDYCIRMTKMGLKIIIARDVFIFHHGSKSFANYKEGEYKKLLDKNLKILKDKWGEQTVNQTLMVEPYYRGTIGIPHGDFVTADFNSSLIGLQGTENVCISMIKGSFVTKARNDIVNQIRGDWLFFIDSDMKFPPDTLTRLLAHDKDIVGGLCFRKVKPFNPTIYDRINERHYHWRMVYPKDKLFEVDATGCACLLIKRRVFEKMKDPWFQYTDRLSEDLLFCEKAQQCGFKIWIDPTIKPLHMQLVGIGEEHFEEYNKENILKVKQRLGKIETKINKPESCQHTPQQTKSDKRQGSQETQT